MASLMKAVVFEEFGAPDVLKLVSIPVPQVGPGEVLIKVSAAGVNPIDQRLRSGELQAFFKYCWPVTAGWDVAGTIAAVGDEVMGWCVGDAVCALGFTWTLGVGSYAEFMTVDAACIARKPERFTFAQAAALPLVSLTSWQSLTESGRIGQGSKVFIQAGSGGIGSVALTMARHLGATTYTTTRAANFDYVRARGADYPIDYTTTNYVHELRKLAPEGMNLVLETLEQKIYVENAVRITANGGTIIYMNNEPPEMPDIQRRNIHAEWLHHRADGEMLSKLLQLYDDGSLVLPDIETMPLADAAEAHRRLGSGRTRGKLVLEC